MSNFSIQTPGQVVTATTSSSVTSLSGAARFGRDVMIDNPGPNDVYVRSGDDAAVATTACMRILAGEKGAYFKGSHTHLAVISPDGNQPITVFVGDGS